MRIALVTPAPPGSLRGNRVTATRWARILRDLGHRVVVEQGWDGRRCDLLVALHARRSAPSVERFRRRHPEAPIVVALTGTDLYGSIRTSPAARRSLERATRLVVLHPRAALDIPRRFRGKTRVILQSARRPDPRRARRSKRAFEVCVLSHLRAVKDPLRAARAARLLPATSKIGVLHLGAATNPAMAARARAEEASNPRYRWLGEVPRPRARAILARCRLLVLPSKSEGGANVLSEAIAAGVPVLASRIPGSVGILGRDYPGLFAFGNTRALASLLSRAERDRAFYRELERRCARLAPLFSPAIERRAWAGVLDELASRDGRP